MPHPITTNDRDRGSAVLLLLPVVVLAALAAVGAARAGAAVAERARAQTAADAAALAGVTGGRAAAVRLAAANGASMLSFATSGPPGAMTVDVRVRVGGSSATARATDGP